MTLELANSLISRRRSLSFTTREVACLQGIPWLYCWLSMESIGSWKKQLYAPTGGLLAPSMFVLFLSKVDWKKQSGFDAFVWSGVLSSIWH